MRPNFNNSKMLGRFKSFYTAGLAAAALFFSGCTPGTEKPDSAAPVQPPPSETELADGERIKQALLSQYPEDLNPADQQQVLGVISRLLDAAGDPDGWNVTILSDGAEVNAAAAPGKQLFVWTGLIESVNDDEELAAVLAHEIGHVFAGHVNQIDIGSRYAEASELQADIVGLDLMARSGYDPKKALTFWRRIARSGASRRKSDAGYFSLHPTTEQRIKNIEAALPAATSRYAAGQW